MLFKESVDAEINTLICVKKKEPREHTPKGTVKW